MTREKIVLIDGSGYFFRAYYAIQRLSTSKGFPTNAIYGFINMLIRVLDVEKPTRLAIVFDSGKPTFRKERYPEYKANRSAAPDDLVKQIPHIFRAVDAFGIRRFEKEGFEADDIIATVAARAEQEGFQVEIITGDKDLMQLVNDHVTLYDTMKEKRYDQSGVQEKLGVLPKQVVDFLSLMGDTSDNIPGVTGIGEKTAADLIRQFGSLDGIYASIDQIKQQKRRETLITEKDMAYLSRELAEVRRDVPVTFQWDEFNYRGPVLDTLAKFFEEFEFQNLMKRFELKSTDTEKQFKPGKYEAIQSEVRLKEIVDKLRYSPYVAIDTETTSLAIHDAKLVGISLCGSEAEAYYIPVGHCVLGIPEARAEGQLDEAVVRAALKPLLEDPKVKKLGQNLKYDVQILRGWGIDVKGVYADTLLASYLLDPDQPHNLDSLAYRHLGHQNISYTDVTGEGKAQISFAEVAIDKATDYSSEDVDVTLRIHEKIFPLLEQQNMTKLFKEVEIPLVGVLADMEYRGVLIDDKRLVDMKGLLEIEIESVQSKIFEIAGEPININSPKQLSHLLFEKLKLPVIRKTKTGISTDESVLNILSKEHEICRHIVKFREYMKLKSTYVEGLLAQIHSQTHRVHTNYNQTVTATGRLSSTNPNLQNIPAATSEKFDVRSAFVPEAGYSLLSSDYSQVELRLMAHLSQDPELLRAFRNGEDVHDYTGRLIFGTDTISSDQRRIAKTINFGVIYGQTPFGLSQGLGISPKEAKQFIETYFTRYAGVRAYLDKLIDEARAKGYAVTQLGRRRYIPEINSSNRMRREMAERAAINAPLQGTAADMIKLAMVNLFREFKAQNFKSRMIMQVHDELIFEVHESEKAQVEKVVRDGMESALPLSVPLKVDVGWGQTWSQCS